MNITSLSPSMVLTYLTCARRFFYSEVMRLPYLPGPALAYGAAFHETMRETHYQKINTQKDLKIDLLMDFFCEDLEYRDVDWSTQSLSQTKDEGVISVRSYMQKIAPSIQPAHVEHSWIWRREGKVTISGKTDLITVKNRVRELKTTGRKVSKPKDGHGFQIGTYIASWRAQTGLDDIQGDLDYSIRGKDTVCSIPVTFNSGLSAGVLATFDDVAGWIQHEAWPPSRYGNYLCSRKYCDHWQTCEDDCGGRVKD